MPLKSGQVSAAGNNTVVTPAAGRRLRVHYLSYNPTEATVEAAFRFGTSGELFLRNKVTANSVIAKEFGNRRPLEGPAGQALVLNLDTATPVNWNAIYVEL